jgi:molybdenum cofactor cytidylyltransferase
MADETTRGERGGSGPPTDAPSGDETPDRVTAVVIAAGFSQRMGRVKSILPLWGKPMLWWTVHHILQSERVDSVMVVTGHAAAEVTGALEGIPVSWVFNDIFGSGMLSSVQAGLRELPKNSGAFLLALGDQPVVSPLTIREMIDEWKRTGALIVQPTYRGKHGHPLLFSATLVPEILALPVTETLRACTSAHQDDRVEVPVLDSGVVTDIDTPADYHRVAGLHFEDFWCRIDQI